MGLRPCGLPLLLAAALVLPAGEGTALAQSAATSPELSTAVSVHAPDEPAAAEVPLPLDLVPAPPPAPTASSSPPPAAAALPAGSGVLDSATVQRIVDRLVSLHFLANAADAQDPDLLTQAIREFQSNAGISPSGTLDRDTVGRLTTP
ncbi:peptidoglycan-binding domain-containing protein [Novosphingobium sp.]|uniref:peptidoglycan-binding domain-containing protein n=1 Tax=Novosphingobium sp. TaxID=1874826 RepID=UPI0026236417|nr:peptidoglycan-binding domain-containing protein [Novosphingobium sp.]